MGIQEDLALVRSIDTQMLTEEESAAFRRILDAVEVADSLPAPEERTEADGLPWSEFRKTGLLWLFNRSCLHPRGYALALHFREESDDPQSEPTGFSIMGDGRDPWQYAPEADELEALASVEDLLMRARVEN